MCKRSLMCDLTGQETTPKATVIYEDNHRCVAVAQNPVSHGRSKHIDIKYHYVREQVAAGTIDITECRGDDMVADILTKAVKRDQFQLQAGRMGIA